MNRIPSVDLRDFLSENPEKKQRFIDEIGMAYENIGFVALVYLRDRIVALHAWAKS